MKIEVDKSSFLTALGIAVRGASTRSAVQTLAANLSFPLDLVVRGSSVYCGETGIASGRVLASAQSMARESSRLKLEVAKFLQTVRAG